MSTPPPTAAPTIAVVIPVHNMAGHLFRAVTSVIWQLLPGDELIVVDDGSTDLEDHAGLGPLRNRMTWLVNAERRGVSFSRNRGIRAARAEWIKPLDADDVLAPFALDLLRNSGPVPEPIHVLAGGCHRIVSHVYRDYLCDTHESLQRILQRNPILPSAVFLRRSAVVEVGLFDERIDFEQDWDLWLRLHERFGLECFASTMHPVCYYWIDRAERAGKRRHATVDGVPVREYFRQRYHATPID